MEGFDSLTPRMNNGEVIWYRNIMDVSINGKNSGSYIVTKCENGFIELQIHGTSTNEVRNIKLALWKNETEEKPDKETL